MYNSTLDEGFLVFKVDGTARSFSPSKKGLYFSDLKSDVTRTFINTLDNNKTKYTIKEYSDAVHARSLQNIIGQPNTQEFIKYMEQNMIPNWPVTKADITRAEDIFGANIGALQGKMVRKRSSCIVTTIHKLTAEIIQHHSKVTLEANIITLCTEQNSFHRNYIKVNTFLHSRTNEERKIHDNCHIHQTSNTTIS